MSNLLIEIIVMCIGYIVSIITNSKVIETRIKSLEKKVDKHNNVVERTFILEGKVHEIERELNER